MLMKKYLALLVSAITIIAMSSCSDSSSDNGGGGGGGSSSLTVSSLAVKGGSIIGAKALAVASKNSSSNKAKGSRADMTDSDAETVDVLYKVSSDGKFIEVNYTFEVEFVETTEGEDGKKQKEYFTQQIQSSLQIHPNFVYDIADDYLWLANCFFYIPGYESMENNAVKKALTKIRDEYNTAHRATHGGQYIIRKSDGVMFTWEIADGAPKDMSDGYNPPSMLFGWLHSASNKVYVREGGYFKRNYPHGRVVRLDFNGTTVKGTEVIPLSKDVCSILPAENNNLGVVVTKVVTEGNETKQFPSPYVFVTSSNKLVPLNVGTYDVDHIYWSLLSINGTLYAMENYHRGDANPGANILRFYRVNVNGDEARVGDAVASLETSVGWYDDKFFGVGASTDKTSFTFFTQDYQNDWKAVINTFYPDEKRISSRYLPDHYNENSGLYVDGIACNEPTEQGFYVCDLSKDQAEYVTIDWSGVQQYKAQVQNLEAVHFEAANMSEKYVGKTADGKMYTFWVPITGENQGKAVLYTDENGDADLDVKVLTDI